MAFDPGKVNKLQDQLESLAFDWMLDRVCSFYNVSDVAELASEQASELYAYANSDECDLYVGTALRSLVYEWEGEHGESISGEVSSI